jgi:hypothetical protein
LLRVKITLRKEMRKEEGNPRGKSSKECSKILDAWSGGGWGVFIALNHHIAVGDGCC